ncbi:hypothetical protein VNO77_20297 [Canavalia gladiata]|uniref:Uncharacterized protein n=1 Tax=Canavalia gladiata TaxID=3824 RepID=A0AAN9QL61_CANGL
MRPLRKLIVSVILLSHFLSMQAEQPKSSQTCDFPAIFNFGDSNSDTGSMSAAFYPAALPYGETFFHEASGRASDGRLIIDFIAKHLGLPYLSAYLDSIGSSYSHGANFGASASTIRRQNRTFFDGGSPFSLEIQVAQFIQFKTRTAKFYKQGEGNSFPRPEELAKALYTFDIGQNDIAAVLQRMGQEDSEAAISDIVSQFVNQVTYLYSEGARTFWIHNTGPIGCLPVAMPIHNSYNYTPEPGYLDQNGCVVYQNDMAKQFNKNLHDTVVKLRELFHDASLVYVDMYSAKYELFSNAKTEGFVDPSKICCGYHEGGNHLYCGNYKAKINNGTEIFAGSCEDPSSHISWDGVHYTEAANSWIANRIVNGSFSDPPLPITRSCTKIKIKIDPVGRRVFVIHGEGNSFPRREEFAKPLYPIDIGKNDISALLRTTGQEELSCTKQKHPVSEFVQCNEYTTQALLPVNNNATPAPGYIYQNGCVVYQNDLAEQFNKELKDRVIQLRQLLLDTLLDSLTNLKFVVDFMRVEIICTLGWGAHYTEAANNWIANHIVNGSFSDLPLPITRSCKLA